MTRRQVLLAALSSAALAACSDAATTSNAASTPPSSSSGSLTTPTPTALSPTPSPTPSPADAGSPLPATHPWVARRGEVEPAVKRVATSLVEAVSAWSAGRGDLASARARARAAGFDAGLADQLAPLLGAGRDAVVQVRDAQYGGILSASASVLVVVDQWRRAVDGSVHAGGSTLDIRLVAASPRWRVVAVNPATPGPAATALSSTARQVLADARLVLPYAAHADVSAGRVHDSVLTMLLGLATQHVVDVSVMRSGHPLHVFGTGRTSDHPRGRAVDVWALDHRPLVVPSNHSLAVSGMRYAASHGAYNVGGPVSLGGPQYFSDRTHQDHIHLGFDH